MTTLLKRVTLPCLTLSTLRTLLISCFACVICVKSALAQPTDARAREKKAQTRIQLQQDQQRIEVKSIVVASQGANEESGVSVKKLSRKAMELRQNYPADIKVDELHQIADALTLYVRNLGYSFDTIYLPPQKVKRNVVHFRYQQALLKKINVINKTEIHDSRISAPFSHLLNRVLYAPRVENMVYALQAQSNISVFAFYSRGRRAGEVVLNLRAEERSAFNYSIRGENYGAQVTGKNRIVSELKYKGVFSAFDQASVALLGTQGEGDSTYAFLSYRYPFKSLNSDIEVSLGDTRYALGEQLEVLELEGDSRTARITIKRKIGHSPYKNHSVSFSTFNKESSLSTGLDNSELSSEKSAGAKLSWQGSIGHRKNYWRFAYGASYTNGRFDLGGADVSEEFEKIEYHVFASALIGGNNRFALSPKIYLRGQVADDVDLPGLESFSLGGVYGVRSTPAGGSSANAGMLQSLEFHFSNIVRTQAKGVPLVLSPYVFFDKGVPEEFIADGVTEDLELPDLEGAGIGFNFNWGRFSTNITYAKAQNDNAIEGDDDSQVYVQMRWQ